MPALGFTPIEVPAASGDQALVMVMLFMSWAMANRLAGAIMFNAYKIKPHPEQTDRYTVELIRLSKAPRYFNVARGSLSGY
jgi:hypothetical protein